MAKKISFAFIAIFAFAFFSLSQAKAQIQDNALSGLNETANTVTAFQSQTSQTYGSDFLATKAGQIIGLILSFVGVLFLILMIYAGILWMTASGNEQQVATAKGLLINAVIGMIIVFSAYALTTFLGTQLLQ